MPGMRFNGPLSLRVAGFLAINRIAILTYARHALGRRLEPTWDAHFEIGIRLWRRRFTHAMRTPDISWGRQILDSVLTETDDVYDVAVQTCAQPRGDWVVPKARVTEATLLYCHGGGYTFRGEVTMFCRDARASLRGAPVYARLSSDARAHPAQAEDALTAWHYVMETTPPEKVVVIGDSAGGHMPLMLPQSLRTAELPQPALCVGLPLDRHRRKGGGKPSRQRPV